MSFTCPECGMTSHNPNDERFGWCGNCESFTAPDAKARALALAEGERQKMTVTVAPEGMEYRCEECAFATPWEEAALAHCDEKHHSLGLAPIPRLSGDCKCRFPGYFCDRCDREFMCGAVAEACPECGQGREGQALIDMMGKLHDALTEVRRDSPERFIDPLTWNTTSS